MIDGYSEEGKAAYLLTVTIFAVDSVTGHPLKTIDILSVTWHSSCPLKTIDILSVTWHSCVHSSETRGCYVVVPHCDATH